MSKEKKSLGVGIMLLVALFSLVLGAGGVWYYTNMTQAADVHNETSATPSVPSVTYEPIFLDIDPFTVTLRNEYDSRVLYTAMTLRLADHDSKERLIRYLPVIRSRILSELTTLNPARLNDREEIAGVGERIRQIVRNPISPEQQEQNVTEVLLTSFVVQ